MYLSGFKSLESLESLARLLKKVLKSCETFKIQDFANASPGTWVLANGPKMICQPLGHLLGPGSKVQSYGSEHMGLLNV